MRESEPEKRRKSLIYIRLTNVQEHLYPHKGAFFRGSFFVACPAQKEENRLYIIILQKLRPTPRTENEKTARKYRGCPNYSDSPSLHS